MTDLIAGRVDAMFNTTGSLLQLVRFRGLAVSSGERFETAPELPAIAESVPGFDVTSCMACLCHPSPCQDRGKNAQRIVLFLLNLS